MFRNGYGRKRIILLLLGAALALGLQGCRSGEDQARQTAPEGSVSGELAQMNATADELYKLTTTGRLVEARAALERLGEQVASASYAGVTGVEGVDALTDAVTEAKRRYNAVQIEPEQVVREAARLKLATDALTHPRQPMWLQYYKVLNDDTKKLEDAVLAGNKTDVQARFIQMKDHYDTIRVSVWISRTPQEGEQMDSLLTFFGKYTEPAAFQQEVLVSGIHQWREALRGLFRQGGDRTAYVPIAEPDQPVLWTLTIGSVIVAVLAYAGWRMFRGQQQAAGKPRFRGMDGE